MNDILAHDLLADILNQAKKIGADAADTILVQEISQSVSQRLGNTEAIERSEDCKLGLRVFVGNRQAAVSTTDFKKNVLNNMIERAIAMAKVAPENSYAGLADPTQIARKWPYIEMFDKTELSVDNLIERAQSAEDAALAVSGITNSEGAEARFTVSEVTMSATNGFIGAYKQSSYSLGVAVIAGTDCTMERDYDYTAKVFDEDLDKPADVGRQAGERTVRRLNPRPVKTCRVPVVIEPRAARSMLNYFASAISGLAIARGTSFLKYSMNNQLFPENIRIMDEPHRPRGFRSKPFDAEGLATSPRAVVDNGRLTSWILDLTTARQLGLDSTANAVRSTSSNPEPSVSNFYMIPGKLSPKQLINEVEQGLFITDLMGTSVNLITGDYSQAAVGYWINNGEITYPVSEITIGGHLEKMFASIVAANDLMFQYGTDCPTIRIDGLTVAGKGE
ncbi:modulator of DNA gyrase family protein [Candidatus Endolissoclinum faulkneri L2]|uniref:Modulator of DNA gyrase family protein n=1 Tax=Candidatus Endolissoclinum faulkneri L2 TaxID=1193729 RepID=K7Z4Y2_9PROT|nr:TldD/PmbA family protein [Candidatus Endolissoclinum faulkneri]AFX99103.1 modulator of DNA gyrase family protein [Candidatus Endolissoclinum faulkneri L2]